VGDRRDEAVKAFEAEIDAELASEKREHAASARRAKGSSFAAEDRAISRRAIKRLQDRQESRRQDLLQRWQSALTITDVDGVAVTASVAEAFDDMDLRAVARLQYQAPHEYFSRNAKVEIVASSKSGLRLDVRGDDKGWVVQTRGLLLAEAKRGLGWWGVLRQPVVAALIFGLALCGPYIAFAPLLISKGAAAGDYFAVYGIVPLFIFLLGALPAIELTDRIVPAFELHADGRDPRGATTVRLLIGLGIDLALGVAGNLLTR